MFTAHCPHEQQNVLLNLSSIETLAKVPGGFRVTFLCTCGHRSTTQMSHVGGVRR